MLENKKKNHIIEEIFFPFRIFSVIIFSFIFGLAAVSFLNLNYFKSWPIFLFIFLAILVIILGNYLLKNKYTTLLAGSLFFFFTGAFYYMYFDRNVVTLPYDLEVEIMGMINKKPEISSDKQKIILRIDQISSNCDNCIGNNVLVNTSSFPVYHFGQIIKIKTKITKPEKIEEFDYPSYLKRQQIYGLITATNQIEVVGVDKTIYHRFLGALFNFSDLFENRLNRVLAEPHASLGSGILLGVRRNIPEDLMLALQKTGLTHIIALSGYNVTIIIILLSTVLMPYLGPKKTFLTGAILIVAFILMTGCAASVVRAGIFTLVIAYGQTIGRRADQLNIILLTALIMLLYNPLLLRYDIGFQLSFAAFIGLVYFAPIIKSCLGKISPNKIIKSFLLAFPETLGAQCAVLPILIIQFGTMSLISPLANLMVVWVLPYTMLLIFLTGVAAIISLPFGQIMSLFLWPFLEYIVKAVSLLGALPFAAINLKL